MFSSLKKKKKKLTEQSGNGTHSHAKLSENGMVMPRGGRAISKPRSRFAGRPRVWFMIAGLETSAVFRYVSDWTRSDARKPAAIALIGPTGHWYQPDRKTRVRASNGRQSAFGVLPAWPPRIAAPSAAPMPSAICAKRGLRGKIPLECRIASFPPCPWPLQPMSHVNTF